MRPTPPGPTHFCETLAGAEVLSAAALSAAGVAAVITPAPAAWAHPGSSPGGLEHSSLREPLAQAMKAKPVPSQSGHPFRSSPISRQVRVGPSDQILLPDPQRRLHRSTFGLGDGNGPL